MWYIRDVAIKNQVVIAPMAGISNTAFRTIVKEFGAGLIYSEMLSDKAISYNNVKTLNMSKMDEMEHPLTMQIFGHDIDTMVIKGFFNYCSNKKLSSRRIKNTLALLKQFLQYAKDKGLTDISYNFQVKRLTSKNEFDLSRVIFE